MTATYRRRSDACTPAPPGAHQMEIDWTLNFEQLDRDAAIMAANLGLSTEPKPKPKRAYRRRLSTEAGSRKIDRMARPILSFASFTRCWYLSPDSDEVLPIASEYHAHTFTRWVKLHLPLLLYPELATLDFTCLLDRWYIIVVMLEEKVKLPTFYLSLAQSMAFLGESRFSAKDKIS